MYTFFGTPCIYLYCLFQVVTIDKERLISEKQNNKASAEGGRLPKGAMLLRELEKMSSSHLPNVLICSKNSVLYIICFCLYNFFGSTAKKNINT